MLLDLKDKIAILTQNYIGDECRELLMNIILYNYRNWNCMHV